MTSVLTSSRCSISRRLQHLLDQVFVLMCDGDRLEQLNTNLEHVQHLLDPKL